MLFFYLNLINILKESFIPHIFLISLTCLFVTYKKLFVTERTVIILRAIDFKIENLLEFYSSFMILISYFSIFFISIIILRVNSLGRSIDMWLIIKTVNDFYKSHSIIYTLIYVGVILCIFIWLILSLNYVHKIVRFHANRLHILFCESSKKSTSYNKLPTFVLYNYNIIAIALYEFLKRQHILPKKYSSKIFVKLLSLEEHFSLVVLIIGFTYDVIFNNMTLYYIFYLLPFILIYKLYRDILHFYNSRLYFDNYDCAIYCIIYQGSLKNVADEEITLISVENYIQRDFKPEAIEI